MSVWPILRHEKAGRRRQSGRLGALSAIGSFHELGRRHLIELTRGRKAPDLGNLAEDTRDLFSRRLADFATGSVSEKLHCLAAPYRGTCIALRLAVLGARASA